MTIARYIMIGGFLGAGKSTSIIKLAQHLDAKGLKVGLITNDQGHALVDTQNVKSHGFAVEEIPGGCFCCRFNSLMDAAENLKKETRPDIFIAEPVGSCTDLVASVSYPLRRIYGDSFTVSPLSVVVDPSRALAILGLEKGRRFSEKVAYIYLKQLEEAEMIVINKIDLLESERLDTLKAGLAERFPNAKVLTASAREGDGLEAWFQEISSSEQPPGEAMELDYKIYAEGEALLGWLNATVEISNGELMDGDALLTDLANETRRHLDAANVEVAHFKMTLSPEDGSGELAVINLVGSHHQPEFSQTLSDPIEKGQVIVNLRAEGEPNDLRDAVTAAVKTCNETRKARLDIEHLEFFKPGEPKPIYRMKTDSEEPVAAQ